MKTLGLTCKEETQVSPGSSRAQGARCTTLRAVGCSLGAFLLSLSPARADVVADWTRIALHTVIASDPARVARDMAIVHVAMFETMNFIEGAYVPRFLVQPSQPLGASGDAAAAAAAHHVLVQLHPEQKVALDAALRYSVAGITDSAPSMITGRALGANIYGVLRSDTPAHGDDSEANGLSRISRVTDASAVAWYWIVPQLVEARQLKTIQSARLHAIVSLALNDVYGTRHTFGSEIACLPCAAGAAVQVILESEFGPAGGSGKTLAGAGATRAAYAPTRIREYARGLAAERVGGAGREASTRAGEERGRRLGLQALTYFKPVSVSGLQ